MGSLQVRVGKKKKKNKGLSSGVVWVGRVERRRAREEV